MASPRVEALTASIEAWNRRDFDAWAEGFTEDVVWDPSPVFIDQEPVHGRAALRRWGDSVFRVWERFRLETLEIREEPQQLVQRVRFEGRGRSAGIDVVQELEQVFEFRDDEVHPSRVSFRRSA